MSNPPFNQDRINPIYRAGAIHINAKLNARDVASRIRRANGRKEGRDKPYYDAPGGIYEKTLSHLRVGEIAFRNRDFSEHETRDHSGIPYAFSGDAAISVMTTLNLLGNAPVAQKVDDKDAREAILTKLQVVGVVISGNSANNESNITLQTGGLYTLVNNGIHNIETGTWVMIYAPDGEEIASGRNGNDKDNGRVVLRVKPYEHSVHRLTPGSVIKCWEMMKTNQNGARSMYLDSYIRMCAAMVKSVCGIVVSGVVALTEMGANDAPIKFANNFDANSFANTLYEGAHVAGSPQAQDAEKMRHAVTNAVFAAYNSQRQSLLSNPALLASSSAIGEYMYTASYHIRNVMERVIGVAKSGAPPGKDFDIALMQPAR